MDFLDFSVVQDDPQRHRLAHTGGARRWIHGRDTIGLERRPCITVTLTVTTRVKSTCFWSRAGRPRGRPDVSDSMGPRPRLPGATRASGQSQGESGCLPGGKSDLRVGRVDCSRLRTGPSFPSSFRPSFLPSKAGKCSLLLKALPDVRRHGKGKVVETRST